MTRETKKDYLIKEDEQGNLILYTYMKELSEIIGDDSYMFVMGYYNCVAFKHENSSDYMIIAVTDPLKLEHYRKLRKVMTAEELRRKYCYDSYIHVSYFNTKYYDFERTELEGELNDR